MNVRTRAKGPGKREIYGKGKASNMPRKRSKGLTRIKGNRR